MSQSHACPLALLPLLCLLVPLAYGAETPGVENADAAIIAAESALQAGDCGVASQGYVAAVQGSYDLKLLQRATEISLGCGQYAAGQKVAERWRALAPAEAASYLSVVRSQLARAHLKEARSEWLVWLNSRAAAADELVGASIEWLVRNSGAELSFAMLRAVKHPLMNGKNTQLRMSQLAIQSYNYQLALKYGEAARRAGAPVGSIDALRLQALAGLGQADAALLLARQLAGAGDGENLAVADTLLILGRSREAEAELRRLREQPALRVAAEESLAKLQMLQGVYTEAEQRFAGLMRNQATAAVAVYNLALIAERRGEVDDAVRGYELLANTGLDAAARGRIAGLYMQDGEKGQAIRMLSANEGADPEELVAAELAQAVMLSKHGAAAEGVTRLDAALKDFPGHPEISYQRAVLLESTDPNAAIAELEAQLKARPQDMNLANALGFTMADHKRDLARAAKLVASALKEQPDNPAILDSQGWVLYRQGNVGAALPVLQRAFTAYREGDIGAHLGEVLWTLNRRDEARTVLEQALAADPENDYLASTAARFVPGLSAPKPSASRLAPALDDGPRTSI